MDARLSNLNNEDLLLMYLSGELDAASARQVEARLARDENLRAEFESLKQMDTGLQQWATEENSQPVARLDASMRDALILMRHHTLTWPLAHSDQRPRLSVLRLAWRAAVAAILVVGVVVLFARRSNDEITLDSVNPQPVESLASATGATDESGYVGMYDMFDAPMTEDADTETLVQDVAAVGDMAQILR